MLPYLSLQTTGLIILKPTASVNRNFGKFPVFLLQAGDKGAEVVGGEVVHRVAELTGKLTAALLGQHLLQLGLAQRDEGALHPLTGAVALVGDGARLQNLQVKIAHDGTQQRFRVVALLQDGGDRAGGHDAALHLGDGVLPAPGMSWIR